MPERPLHARVAEIERLATEDPERYGRQIRSWTRSGVAAYVGLLIVALAILTLPIWLYLLTGKTTGWLVVPGAAATYALLAALFTRGDGTRVMIPLGPEDAPDLWREVQRVAGELRAPLPALIAVDLSYEAGIFRHARFELWGRGHTVLRLGLAMILSCDQNELRAVLAQALGHHRAGHLGTHLETVRFGAALMTAGHRLERSHGLAWLLIGPIANRYLSHLELLLLPQRRREILAAYEAVLESGAAWAGRRRLLRATVLGPWYATAFFDHRPSFTALREGLERSLDTDVLVPAIGAALRRPSSPKEEQPPLGIAIGLLGEVAQSGDEARLAGEASGGIASSAWEAFFSPEMREELAEWADLFLTDESPELDDEEGPDMPPTQFEAARQTASETGTEVAKASFTAVARDPGAGIVARYDAAATLSALDPYAESTLNAWRGLVDDPYMGADARRVLLGQMNDAYDRGADMDPAARDSAREASVAHHNATRAFLAALHREPGKVVRLPEEFPPDVLELLAKWMRSVPDARRAWALWAAHPRMKEIAWPTLVIDTGLVTGGFRITAYDPKQVSYLAELAFAGPVGIPAFVARDPKEIAAIVGDLSPFWGTRI